MDPNANLQEQERILVSIEAARQSSFAAGRRVAASKKDRLQELRQALNNWIASGGFEPEWSTCPKASEFFKRAK